MTKDIVFLTLHGMGDENPAYADRLANKVAESIGESQWDRVHFEAINYQSLMQPNQEEYFDRVRAKVDNKWLRKAVLYRLADPGTLESSRNIDNGAYELTQKRIFDALGRAYHAVGNRQVPVMMIGESLGAQVLSSYVWDANRNEVPDYGLWQRDHSSIDAEDLKFRKLKSFHRFMSIGCNIPIFVSGLPRADRAAFAAPNTPFKWFNYYDEDDVLGWPLQGLSSSFDSLVTDVPIEVGRSVERSTVFSHTRYWKDGDVYREATKHLNETFAAV
jgi:hypothetical protein